MFGALWVNVCNESVNIRIPGTRWHNDQICNNIGIKAEQCEGYLLVILDTNTNTDSTILPAVPSPLQM